MLDLVFISLWPPSFWNSSSVFVFHDFNRLGDEVVLVFMSVSIIEISACTKNT